MFEVKLFNEDKKNLRDGIYMYLKDENPEYLAWGPYLMAPVGKYVNAAAYNDINLRFGLSDHQKKWAAMSDD